MVCFIPLVVDVDLPYNDVDSCSEDEITPKCYQPQRPLMPKTCPAKRTKLTLITHNILSSPIPKVSGPKVPAQPGVAPFTTMEWKKALAEVKRDYTSKRFRQCSSRCQDILDRITDHHRVEKAYLVFLSFYAATALEMQVRSLHHTSLYREKMLLQARGHYRRASELVRVEDNCMKVAKPRPMSPFSATSLHSRSSSLSSCMTLSTRASSPVMSEPFSAGSDTPVMFGSPTKAKKRVTFNIPLRVEPMVRPDSPTLGFDEWLGRSSPDIFPDVDESMNSIMLPPSQDDSCLFPIGASLFPLPPTMSYPAEPERFTFPARPAACPDSDELAARAEVIMRYRGILSGIQIQIDSHLTMLEAGIATAQQPAILPPADDEMRTLQLRARVQRLRAEGWPRRRFDAQRYERLRESATADLMR